MHTYAAMQYENHMFYLQNHSKYAVPKLHLSAEVGVPLMSSAYR
jgi:hypothetical protein